MWQKAMDFVAAVYAMTAKFPREELYALAVQLRRCSVSVPSNIAEGFSRRSSADFQRFLEIALGSLFEAQTQAEIAFRLDFCSRGQFDDLYEMTREIERMLCSLKAKIKGRRSS